MVGVIAVMATSFKRAYASMPCLPGVLYLVTLTSWQATVDPLFHQRLMDTHRRVWLSLFWGHFFFLGPCPQQVLFVTSKSLFRQSTFLGLLLYPWMWSILFLVGSNILLSMFSDQLQFLEFSQGKMSTLPSIPPS